MQKPSPSLLLTTLSFLLLAIVAQGEPLQPVEMPTKTLIPGGEGWRQLGQTGAVTAKGATVSYPDGNLLIQVPKGTSGSVEIRPPQGLYDADEFTRLVFELKNQGLSDVQYELRIDNPRAAEAQRVALAAGRTSLDLAWGGIETFAGRITAGQAKNGNILFVRKNVIRDRYPELLVFSPPKPAPGMKSSPGGLLFDNDHAFDPSKIEDIRITVLPSDQDVKLSVGAIYASHPPVAPLLKANPEAFFPFVDGYGQYIHETWPGKVTRDEDLRESARQEEKDLADHPAPADRSRFGGWTKGPHLEATGFFRTEKYQGKWWLVDPEGWLFWSHGVTCCGLGGADTRMAGREKFFSDLPASDSPLAQFMGKEGNFTYTQANLYRKFGSDWKNAYRDLSVRRLASWGMNTMGAWSNGDFTRVRKTAYVVDIEYKRDTVLPKHLPDVFSPTFRPNVEKALATRSDAFNDPWCIGIFLDNEINFPGATAFVSDLALEAKENPSKIEWVEDLKRRYSTVGEFNRLTGAKFAGWDAVLANKNPLKVDGIADEAASFYKRVLETYFETCRDELKKVAPSQLYLGCRFLQVVRPEVVSVASQYCDVVSFNVYEYGVTGRRVAGIDKPFIVGEFHFGALDRGMFGTGNRWAGDQQDRGVRYENYLASALSNPACVGAHWFQYNSQALTGRVSDGENFQIGLADVTGAAYPELRDSIRKVGNTLYEARMNAPIEPMKKDLLPEEEH
ncbi:hypothetical protein SAMN05444156_2439 [Verrucomicrobium sp. GAS474]|uniref:hypothetical protein n=1 Tax=Verrucomicrobium sp. GAS474 TaxID=1882831 RepID=UPI00087AE3B5|nr:hypothetical protein [Verrucomicrobium sp. GAS474]SDU17932.1 hypothetical protein SAMN05444156_2439 [Verrucomicrobium sp. GAS474]